MTLGISLSADLSFRLMYWDLASKRYETSLAAAKLKQGDPSLPASQPGPWWPFLEPIAIPLWMRTGLDGLLGEEDHVCFRLLSACPSLLPTFPAEISKSPPRPACSQEGL